MGLQFREIRRSVILLSLVAWLVQCGISFSPAPVREDIRSVSLFLHRASLAESEFEQFKLVGDHLFVECGVVERGRFLAEEQSIEEFPLELKERYRRALAVLIRTLETDQPAFETPGTGRSFADPGEAELRILFTGKTLVVRTSFDSIAEPDTKVERQFKQVARLLRSAAGEHLCGNKSFYGLSTERL